MGARVLLVDDDQAMGELMKEALRRRGHSCTWRGSADEAYELFGEDEFDVVVTDINMRGMNGLDFCERIVANRRDVPVVVITAFGSLQAAIATIRAGAFDFLTKPFELEQLVLAVERAVQHRELREEVKRLRRQVEQPTAFEDMVGASAAILKVYDLVDRIADSDATVLVTGESGTGKELVARALHRRSRRRDGPLIVINCAAMPEQLLESELFGHIKGSFTDAKSTKKGLLAEASGGTLFLDELGEMPLGMQAKLLRALEARAVRPIGGTSEVDFDARIIAATNRDLESLIEEKRFREDLFYRVSVVHIDLPPLRARGNDVLLLAHRFVERFAERSTKHVTSFSSEVATKLLAYAWPGNVRELQNCIERAVALARFEEITVDDLPERIRNYKSSHVVVASIDPTELVPMEEVERRYIQRVMEAVGGNKTIAARALGFDRTTLYRKLEKYGLASG
jgi:two-component system response regulator HydG